MPASPASPARLLIVDDEPDLRTLYELSLLREGYRVESAENVAQARELLRAQRFDVVITDMRLPDGLGQELLEALTAEGRPERCIVITAYGSAESAVEALKAGAFDYLTKPVDLPQFRAVVATAVAASPRTAAAAPAAAPSGGSGNQATTGSKALPDEPDDERDAPAALRRLIGDSAPMRAVRARIAKVARSMAPVLVQGESGTGKELVANAIHACSHRGDGPFVAVNCGAIPEALLEAEFFGARKGSYTGAAQDRKGFFQAAEGGTLFLDEIGDLPLSMQSKLLRALQERKVRALGSTQEEPVDVRIVSATHKNLALGVQEGRFRQDLYYRLNVIELDLPPLRERREDLPLLCDALLDKIAAETGLPVPSLTERQLQAIAREPLEGNVRELENLLHRAIALGDAQKLQVDTQFGEDALAPLNPPASGNGLAAGSGASSPMPAAALTHAAPGVPGGAGTPGAPALEDHTLPADLGSWLDEQERQVLVRALEETGFNRTAAAAKLGLNLRQIRYRMARLDIQAPQDDDERR